MKIRIKRINKKRKKKRKRIRIKRIKSIPQGEGQSRWQLTQVSNSESHTLFPQRAITILLEQK